MSIEKKKPSEKLISLINEAIDTGVKLRDIVDKIWEQGAREGFSREEIAEIVRPIARQRGLNKDQVYYLTHKPELLEKSKLQYEELKTRNIPINNIQESLNTLSPEELKEVIRYHRTMKLQAQEIANVKGIKLVDNIDNRPGYLIQKALRDMIRESEDLVDTLTDLTDNWNSKYKMDERLSKMKPDKRKELTLFIRAFGLVLDFTNDLLASCVDVRYSFSLWKWAELVADVEARGYGYAREKHKIEIIRNGVKTGKYRKITVEEIKKAMPKVHVFMKKAVIGMKAYALWMGFIELKDIRVELTEYLEQRDRQKYGDTLQNLSLRF